MRRIVAIKPLVWLVTIALLAQSWFVPLATASVSAEVDGIVICTASGFKVISLPDDLRSILDPAEEHDEHDQRHLDCTACLVQAISQALSDNAFSDTPVIWPDYPLRPVAFTAPPPSLWFGAHPSRAPPKT